MIEPGPNTFSYMNQIAKSLHLPGDVAEFGVFKGNNSWHYASLMQYEKPNKRLHLFDTFSGLPRDVLDKCDLTRFDDTSLESVTKVMEPFDFVDFHTGMFNESVLEMNTFQEFCAVIIDCDLYQSYLDCLDYVYDRMVVGGVIIFDEYYSKKYPLARVAVDEFFSDKKEKPEIFWIDNNGWERWRIVKQLSGDEK